MLQVVWPRTAMNHFKVNFTIAKIQIELEQRCTIDIWLIAFSRVFRILKCWNAYGIRELDFAGSILFAPLKSNGTT